MLRACCGSARQTLRRITKMVVVSFRKFTRALVPTIDAKQLSDHDGVDATVQLV